MMRASTRLRILAALGLLSGAALMAGCRNEKSSTPGGATSPNPTGHVYVEDSGNPEVDKLVAQLVSWRPPRYTSGQWHMPPTPDPDDNIFITPEVQAAFNELNKMGPPIFPALVKHIHDDRYCYSRIYAAWLNRDVGDGIVDLLGDGHYMHSGYKFRDVPGGNSAGYVSFKDYLDARGAESWAEWAKDRSRLDIQLDFIDWCIAVENRRGYTDNEQKKRVLGNYEDARRDVRAYYAKYEAFLSGPKIRVVEDEPIEGE